VGGVSDPDDGSPIDVGLNRNAKSASETPPTDGSFEVDER